jgi:hypothetical protein
MIHNLLLLRFQPRGKITHIVLDGVCVFLLFTVAYFALVIF